MRIDPSKLSEPLSHILNAGATDAAGGQKATGKVGPASQEDQLDRLDQMLLRRLRANAMADAANSVVSFQDAQARMDKVAQLSADDPAGARRAQGAIEPGRARGLLGD